MPGTLYKIYKDDEFGEPAILQAEIAGTTVRDIESSMVS
jgi:hypothetical protein